MKVSGLEWDKICRDAVQSPGKEKAGFRVRVPVESSKCSVVKVAQGRVVWKV